MVFLPSALAISLRPQEPPRPSPSSDHPCLCLSNLRAHPLLGHCLWKTISKWKEPDFYGVPRSLIIISSSSICISSPHASLVPISGISTKYLMAPSIETAVICRIPNGHLMNKIICIILERKRRSCQEWDSYACPFGPVPESGALDQLGHLDRETMLWTYIHCDGIDSSKRELGGTGFML